MDRRRGASRIFRTSVDKENEGERYYSALGGEATYSGIFGGDVPRSMEISDRIRFQSPESIVLEDLPRPGILSQFHHNEVNFSADTIPISSFIISHSIILRIIRIQNHDSIRLSMSRIENP